MSLRAGYQGFKKLLPGLKLFRPGCLGIDNAELSKTFFPRSEQAVTGAVNLCPMKVVSGTPNGLTITAAADGTFSVSGTASGTDNYGRTIFTLNKGTYYLSGVTGSGSKYELHLKIGAADVRCYDGFTEFTIANDNTELYIEFIYRSGAVIDTVVKPMISLASDIPYVPYAMTNSALTDAVGTLQGSADDQKTAINAILTAASEAADFAAFKTALGGITPVTRSIQVTPETREENPVKKTTRKKSTAKADTEKEGE